LIVEAALTGEREHALAALSSDPLITDQSVVNSLLDDLLASQSTFVMR
jgi:alpha-galactosidase/6-phospho-beta-glucosidase family protein